MTRTVHFVVVGQQKLFCLGCEQRVGNALRRLLGVQSVRTSFQPQRVAVTIDPIQIDPEQVRAKLGQLGHQVRPLGVAG